MNKVKLYLLFFLTIAFSLTGNAQSIKSFATEPVAFLKDLEACLAETNKKEAEKIVEAFAPIFNTKFTAQQQQSVMVTSNNMLKKRMKGYPDFVNYVQALTAFAASGQTEATFTAWHSTLDKAMGKINVRRFGDYLEICNLLFTSNTLYESSSVRWASDNNKYNFEFDSLPKIVFPALTLKCYAKSDSSVIATTKGFYYPNNLLFYGFGGKVNFTRGGIAAADAFAELKKYAINLKGAEYGMDSVTFSYKKYFTEQLKGKYIDKLLANVTDSTASYPRFVSYQTNLSIKDLIKDADYKGGFSLQGSKMVGSGSRTQDASLTFFRNGKPQLIMKSKGFVVKTDRIVSVNAAAIIYFDKDSIFHPGVEFKYIYDDRKVTLIKNTQTAVNSPYFDSYHKMDLDFEELLWKVDDPIMDLKMVTGAGESKLKFESVNYFSRERFEKIQGISEVHPLYTIKQFCEKNNTKVIRTADLAQQMKLNENQVRNLLIGLSSLGFMAFDADEDKAVVKDKVLYYLNARTGKVDYDEIKIESLISGKSNATINLLNFDINMEGVSRVQLSDSQEVFIVPTEQQLTLKKNRDMYFAGRVHAGRLDFFGKEFIFKYEDFKVDLKTVDSLRFKVPSDTMDSRGIYPMISIRSVLQQLNGELNIDNPTNKSGYVANNDYPVFNCTNKSYIYYDYTYIFNKVYNRDNFYYHLDPFTIDSLNTLRKEGLVFEGELISAGIFPTFRQTLTVQPDYSLGFQMTTPGEGFSAYGGKGKYTNELSLSHEGLRGKGDIEYLTSTTSSNDIIFFPDSTHANAQKFDIKNQVLAGTHFPDAKAEDVFVNWRPKADKMYVFKKTKNIALYENTASLDGNLILKPSGVTANGTITYDQSSLYSNNINVKDHSYDADTADFNLRSNIGNVLALETKNVKANIDLEKRVGEFNSNGNNANVTFPLNQYISNIQNFKWYMDKSEMEFGSDNAGMNIRESEFISIHPDQDSLKFTAPLATYNLNDYLIKAYKVKELLVADASIIPDSGKIIVEKNAVMRTLENSRVVANTTTRFHTMLNTSINVLGKQNYGGNGDYEYLDQSKIKHLIRLTQIGVDTAKQTFAIGEIPDTSKFSISPTIQYKGKIRIQAAKQNVYFSGFAIVNHHCETFDQNWFGFASDIDPRGVTIPITEPVNETNQKLFSGIFFAGDSTNIYPTFISQKKRSTDAEIISAEGFLTYDDVGKLYKISGQKPGDASSDKDKKKEKEAEKQKEKENPEIPATVVARPVSNSVILDDKTCALKAEGKINLTTNFGQMKIANYGQATFATANDSIYFDEIMAVDFMFNDDALKIMADIITQYPSLQPTNDSRPVYGTALVNMIGKDKADKLITETSLYGMTKKVPEELQHTLTLTDLKFFWSKERTAYYSKGAIGVGLAGKNYIGRMMFGKLEIIRRRSGDVFNLYIEVDGSIWFYFNYARGVMQAISSEEKFNFAIDNMKPEKRVASEKGGLDPYQFMLSTERKKSEFLKRLKDQGM